jgi:hypothetical protein
MWKSFKAIVTSKSGPGLIFAIILAALIPISSSDSALIIGMGLGTMIDPFILITAAIAIFTPGKWYTPIAVMIGGVTLAFVLGGNSAYVPTKPTVRIASGASAVVMGCIVVAVTHGISVAVMRLRGGK